MICDTHISFYVSRVLSYGKLWVALLFFWNVVDGDNMKANCLVCFFCATATGMLASITKDGGAISCDLCHSCFIFVFHRGCCHMVNVSSTCCQSKYNFRRHRKHHMCFGKHFHLTQSEGAVPWYALQAVRVVFKLRAALTAMASRLLASWFSWSIRRALTPTQSQKTTPNNSSTNG